MARSETYRRVRANRKLVEMPNYYSHLPIGEIDAILESEGFKATEGAIYCGADGRSHEQVGDKTWLSFTWHKMEVTGRYEVVAYLS